MALPCSRGDRENNRFREPLNPASPVDTCVAVCNDDGSAIGSTPPAATGPLKVTGESVTDTSTAFPTAANQVGRAALSIRNIDPAESIWIVNSTGITKAAAGTSIWEIGPNETLNTDFDDTNKVTLVADTGKTVSIQILEIKG